MPVGLSVYLPLAAIHLPGCPEPLIERYMLSAGKQWCRDTNGWVKTLALITIASVPDDKYLPFETELSLPAASGAVIAGGNILSVDSVQWRRGGTDEPLFLRPPPQAPEGEDHTITRTPYRYEEGNLIVERGSLYTENGYKSPLAATDTLRVRVVLEPALTDTGFADDIANMADLAIVDRALAELLAMDGKEWSNPKLAGDFQTRYLKRLGNQKTRLASKRTQQPLRVARSPF